MIRGLGQNFSSRCATNNFENWYSCGVTWIEEMLHSSAVQTRTSAVSIYGISRPCTTDRLNKLTKNWWCGGKILTIPLMMRQMEGGYDQWNSPMLGALLESVEGGYDLLTNKFPWCAIPPWIIVAWRLRSSYFTVVWRAIPPWIIVA